MFLQVSVSHSVHRRGSALLHAGIPSPGSRPPRSTPQEQTPPSPQQTATAADGTHPTGMHSCLHVVFFFWKLYFIIRAWFVYKYRQSHRFRTIKNGFNVSGGSRIFQIGAPTPEFGEKPLIWKDFCWNLHENQKKLDWGGGCIPNPHFDPSPVMLLFTRNVKKPKVPLTKNGGIDGTCKLGLSEEIDLSRSRTCS